jgi:uncharacterized protein (DUF305 family)
MHAGAENGGPSSRRLLDSSWAPVGIGALIAVVILAGAWFLYQAWPKPPGDESADVNFLRDMVVHHDQAVTMGLIIRDRTEDQSLHDLATDIVLTQMSQVGMMRGWIDRWDYTLVSKNPHMEWMGHPVDGLMPGMATPAEIEQLRTLPVTEAEILFCQLMIRHHAAGIEMAQAALDRVDDDETRRLAESIMAGQFAEVQALQEDLVERGAAQEPVSTDMSDMPGMDMGTPTGG